MDCNTKLPKCQTEREIKTTNIYYFTENIIWLLSIIVVQSLSHVWLFVTPWTVAHQAPLSSTVSWSLLIFMSIESLMLSKHLILCYPLSFAFNLFEGSISSKKLAFASGGQSIGAPASASVLPMNIQGWFPLGLTGFFTLQSKGLSRIFSLSVIAMKN